MAVLVFVSWIWLVVGSSGSAETGVQTGTQKEPTAPDFTNLQEFAQRAWERFEKLERQVTKQNEKIQELKEKNEELERQTQKLERQNERQEEQIEKLEREKEELRVIILRYALQNKKKTNTVKKRTPSNGTQKTKRADDTGSWEPVVSQLSSRVTELTAEIQTLKNVDTQHDNRMDNLWGSMGSVGGSHYSHTGGAANYLCLPPDPVFDTQPPDSASDLYGAEYEFTPRRDLTPKCAVCRTQKSTTIMVPAENTCRPGWTLEYTGRIMTSADSHALPAEFICVDSAMEYLPGTNGDENGKLLYKVRTSCGSLPCPPYENGKAVVCAVCSK